MLHTSLRNALARSGISKQVYFTIFLLNRLPVYLCHVTQIAVGILGVNKIVHLHGILVYFRPCHQFIIKIRMTLLQFVQGHALRVIAGT